MCGTLVRRRRGGVEVISVRPFWAGVWLAWRLGHFVWVYVAPSVLTVGL
jgi:hypothetical protein